MRDRPANFPFYSSVLFWLCLVFLFTYGIFYSLFAFCRTISIYIRCFSFLLPPKFCFNRNDINDDDGGKEKQGNWVFENRETELTKRLTNLLFAFLSSFLFGNRFPFTAFSFISLERSDIFVMR